MSQFSVVLALFALLTSLIAAEAVKSYFYFELSNPMGSKNQIIIVKLITKYSHQFDDHESVNYFVDLI